jgi:DNA polymerase
MYSVCTVDFETRSFRNVKDTGAWRYAEDPTTEILCLAFRFDNGEIKLWVPGLPFPQEIIDHINTGGMFEAHNAQFERAIWKHILVPKFSIPMPKKWKDTLAACAYKGLPLALDKVGSALNLEVQKNKRGKYLLNTLSVPKGATKNEPDRVYREDLDLMEELYEYCIDDVRAECLLSETIGDLSEPEYKVWVLDQIINQRGVKLDVKAVNGALKIVEFVETGLNKELSDITEGDVTAATQRDKIMTWLRGNGLFAIASLTKQEVEDTIAELERNPTGLEKCLRVLQIRQILAKSSTKKLTKMLDTVSLSDDRIRGLLQYHGAGTGRWAGRLVQPQNFPRGSLEKYCDEMGLDPAECMDLLISIISAGLEDPDNASKELLALFGDPMEAIVTSLRGMFVAEDDCRYLISDFAAIEAVVLAWLAGEEWKLEAFRAINKGEKYNGADDIYCATASQILQRTVTKAEDKVGRQIGKTAEVAFGFVGGLGAWRKFDNSDTYDDEEVEDFKIKWRERHPNTVQLWYGIERAAIKTVRTGERQSYGRISYDVKEDAAGKWLVCILPNGRKLWYYDPVLIEEKINWFPKGRRRDDKPEMRTQLSYQGRDNKKGGAWGIVRSYSGILVENIVQAVSRDLMVEAMIRVEAAGYPIILTVHDEIIAELPKILGSLEEFMNLMSIVPPWAEGCPIGVSGDEVSRYRKV